MRLVLRSMTMLFVAALHFAVAAPSSAPLTLGNPIRNSKVPITGLVALPDSRMVLIHTSEGISAIDLASGDHVGKAKLDPFPDDLPVKLTGTPAFATNRGVLALDAEGKKTFVYDAQGVYAYDVPLTGGGPKVRVKNEGKAIVPLLGIVHVGKQDFAFGVNSRGNLFECRSAPGVADPKSGLVPTKLPRTNINSLRLPLPAMAGGGNYVALGGSDGRIQIWDAAEKTDLYPIPVEEHVLGLAITRDGKTLAALSQRESGVGRGPHVKVFSLPDGKELASWETTGRRLAFSPDGSILAVLRPSRAPQRSHIDLCNARTGKVLHRLDSPDDLIHCFDFTPDGKTIVAAGQAGILHQWDVQSGQAKGLATDPPPPVASVAFLPDGGFGTIHSDGTVRNWNVDGVSAKPFSVHDKQPLRVLRSRDGKVIFSSGAQHDGTVRACDAWTGKELRRLELPGSKSVATSLAESPDGKELLVGATHEGILRVDVESFRIVGRIKAENPSPSSFGGAPDSIVFCADSTIVARDYDSERSWSLKDGRQLLSWQVPTSGWSLLKPLVPLAVSPDGRKFLKSNSNRLSTQEIGKQRLDAVVEVKSIESNGVTAAIYVSASVAAVGDARGKVYLINLTERSTEGKLLGEHLGPVTCLAVSPDGKRLISGSADTSAKVWTLP